MTRGFKKAAVVAALRPVQVGTARRQEVKGIYLPMIRAGNTFITLITGKNSNGGIRGQIKAR
jgi:hypothetical protein